MKKSIYALFIVVIAVVSCQNQSNSNDNNLSNASSEKIRSEEKEKPKGRYAIKSGIIEYKTQMMGMEMKQILTFDDYGNKENTDIEMEMMGTKIHTVTITRDGFIYTLDMVAKTGTKMKGVSPNIDFENLSEEMSREMNLTKLGTEKFLGKTCDKMSIDYTKLNMKGFYLLYKGVPLKIDAEMGSTKMKLDAEKFVENPQIPDAIFEIPSDIFLSGV
ncbi:MAG: hypothetical protein K9H49_04200 [Bacteroidales bacterium]|nr:hypothetical protein [Bacteroidales bacterium]MCF8390029.1 hypothetical protein [Bacteroidales bacterium]